MLNPQFLEILACPACKSSLRYDQQNNRLICNDENRDQREYQHGQRCGLIFSVRGDIPVMLIDEAEKPPDNGGGE